MTTTFAHVVECIDTEARSLDPRRVLLTVLAAPLFAVGWVVGQVFRVVWLVFTWLWTALVVGFRTARGD